MPQTMSSSKISLDTKNVPPKFIHHHLSSLGKKKGDTSSCFDINHPFLTILYKIFEVLIKSP